MKRKPTKRINVHPGELLREEFLKPLGLTQATLSKRSRIPVGTVRKLLSGKHRVTPEIDAGLTKALRTSSGYWLRAQASFNKREHLAWLLSQRPSRVSGVELLDR